MLQQMQTVSHQNNHYCLGVIKIAYLKIESCRSSHCQKSPKATDSVTSGDLYNMHMMCLLNSNACVSSTRLISADKAGRAFYLRSLSPTQIDIETHSVPTAYPQLLFDTEA